jgi:hypothetical protein
MGVKETALGLHPNYKLPAASGKLTYQWKANEIPRLCSLFNFCTKHTQLEAFFKKLLCNVHATLPFCPFVL